MRRRARALLATAFVPVVLGGGAAACNTILGIHGGHPRLDVMQLSAGGAFACALLSDGSVWCWGGDDYGQLGHLDFDADQPCKTPGPDGSVRVGLCAPTPTKVDDVSGAMQIAVGGNFACALVMDGSVMCWGGDDSDQLVGAHASADLYTHCPSSFFEAGTAPQIPCDPVAQKVPLAGPATAIAAGTSHACAIVGGRVACWGTNAPNVLGATVTPIAGQNGGGPVMASGVTSVTQLSASVAQGAEHTCALVEEGRVECWGNDYAGQLGCMNAVSNMPCDVPVVTGATSVVSADPSTCALGAGSTLNCWGSDSFATFGVSTIGGGSISPTTSDYTMVLATADAAAGFFDGRSLHILMVDNHGGLWGWGDNSYGELGQRPGTLNCGNDNSNSCIALPAPISVPDDSGVTVIATGVAFSVAYTSDGVLWAWGQNIEGQLGHPSDGGTCPGRPKGDAPCEWTPSAVSFPAISN
jgi:alpha-tubulin suppressor-like RCC1 family protein